MELEYFRPAVHGRLAEIRGFLAGMGLGWDDGVEFTVVLREGDAIVATGSRQANVLKCIAVAADWRGEDLAARVVTELVKDALAAGREHLFIFTTPAGAVTFERLGFYPVAVTRSAALLENRRDGVAHFVAALETRPTQGVVAAIVANANPFTYGHRHLVERAAAECGLLHLFVLSEDRSRFSAALRMEMVKEGTADLANVLVHPTGDYLVSTATFPTYFIKEQASAASVNCDLDVATFAEHFAKPLRITRRYVGTEPTDRVTRAYNERMKADLPAYGIELVEIPRLERDGRAVSASVVRALLSAGRLEAARELVPPTTYAHLTGMAGHGSGQ